MPVLTAREVYQQLRDAAQGIRTFKRVDESSESGHVQVDIDGWRLLLDVDTCLLYTSPSPRDS